MASSQEVRDALANQLLTTSSLVTKTCSDIIGKPIYISYSHLQQLRLLNLITWSERYHISLEELLTVLLTVWRNKFGGKGFKGLGVSINTLVGKRSKDIIIDYVKKKYPLKENELRVKLERRNSLLSPAISEDCDNPMDFVSEYKEYIKSLRALDAIVVKKYTRRRYRGNPCLD